MPLNRKITLIAVLLLASQPLFSQSGVFAENKILHQWEAYKHSLMEDPQHGLLMKLTWAEYLTRHQKDSVFYLFIEVEHKILKYYDLQATILRQHNDNETGNSFKKGIVVADSLEQIVNNRKHLLAGFREDFTIFNSMKETLENTKVYWQLKSRLQLFPYKMNREYYFNKAEKLYQLRQFREAGIIFYNLQNALDDITNKKLASKRLEDIELAMINQEKSKLIGGWTHHDRRYTCFDDHKIPISLNTTVVLDQSGISILKKDSCLLQSAYTLTPAFDWRAGIIGFKMHIKKTNEIWRLSIPEYASGRLTLWVTYPPPVPYTSSQPYDVYEKIEGARPASVVMVKN